MNKYLSKRIIQKHQPTLVFVAGSWGKTMSIASSVGLLRRLGRKVGVSFEDNDIAAIIAGGGTTRGFLGNLFNYLFSRKYPEMLIIELHGPVRFDKGLLDSVKNKILLIPFVTHADIQQAGSVRKYLEQNCLLIKKGINEYTIIYDSDMVELREELAEYEVRQLISCAIEDAEASFRAQSIKFRIPSDPHQVSDNRVEGINFKIRNAGSTLPLSITGGIGRQHIYAVLESLALMKALDVNLVDSIAAIKDYKVLPGRMTLIPGIKKTLLIDDSYDIDPESAFLAFKEAAAIELGEEQKRYAIIGDIIETGSESEQAHCLLGREMAGMNYDYIIAIGERSRDILRCAKDEGMDPDQLIHFMDKAKAGKHVQNMLKPGDLVVIKGSEKDQFETIVKELMAFPLKAKEDLVVR